MKNMAIIMVHKTKPKSVGGRDIIITFKRIKK